MNKIDVQNLIKATDLLSHRCTSICGKHHGGSWLFDKLMRFFENNQAAESVTIPVSVVLVSAGVVDCEATISRTGNLTMKRAQKGVEND